MTDVDGDYDQSPGEYTYGSTKGRLVPVIPAVPDIYRNIESRENR